MKKITHLDNGCWLWTGSTNTDGYPSLSRKGYRGIGPGNVKGHRYVYEMCVGEIPEGCVVRHSCDNILCLNPEHLSIGTSLDNVKDRVTRGRTNCNISPETYSEIKRLRAEGLSQLKVANIVGCSQMHISKLERGIYKINEY